MFNVFSVVKSERFQLKFNTKWLCLHSVKADSSVLRKNNTRQSSFFWLPPVEVLRKSDSKEIIALFFTSYKYTSSMIDWSLKCVTVVALKAPHPCLKQFLLKFQTIWENPLLICLYLKLLRTETKFRVKIYVFITDYAKKRQHKHLLCCPSCCRISFCGQSVKKSHVKLLHHDYLWRMKSNQSRKLKVCLWVVLSFLLLSFWDRNGLIGLGGQI